MSISKFITSLPTIKVFAMSDSSNHPFVLSFHYEERGLNLYFQITPNRNNTFTKVPVYEGTCRSINTFMDMLIAYGCHYIKRLPISKGEILSRDYLDGLADGIIIPITKSKSKSEIINDFLELLNEDYDDDWTDFCITQRIITP